MSLAEPRLHRSFLYAPGSHPERMRKALTAGADAVVLDLEDAVAPSEKPAARKAVAELLAEAGSAPCDVHVRIDRAPDGSHRPEDLDAAVRPGLDAVRVPKVESARELTDLDERIRELEARRGLREGGVGLYPTFESALGLARMREILLASPRVVRAAIGTSDLLADLLAVGDDDLATLHARSELVLQSRALRLGPPIDSVHTDLDDEPGLEAAARRARSLGFVGKSVIHPRQLAVVHRVFTPTETEARRARRVIDAARAAADDGQGGVELDGEFIDPAVVARARALLKLTEGSDR